MLIRFYQVFTPKPPPESLRAFRDSKEEAFERLREGLRAFGFTGTLGVEDATGLGRPVRYEVG